MICIKCDTDIEKCECPDAVERLEKVLEPSPYLFIGADYRQRIEAHLQDLKRRGPRTATTN